jgi:hypothetical protein
MSLPGPWCLVLLVCQTTTSKELHHTDTALPLEHTDVIVRVKTGFYCSQNEALNAL